MLTARLNANTTDEYIEISPTRFVDECVDCDVTIRIRNWNCPRQESWTKITVNDFGLSLPALYDLHDGLAQWLDPPSAGVTAFSGHFELGNFPTCQLDFHFGPRSDTISSLDKPVVTIKLSFGTTRLEFRVVTDQSCLGLFAATLSQMNYESKTERNRAPKHPVSRI